MSESSHGIGNFKLLLTPTITEYISISSKAQHSADRGETRQPSVEYQLWQLCDLGDQRGVDDQIDRVSLSLLLMKETCIRHKTLERKHDTV